MGRGPVDSRRVGGRPRESGIGTWSAPVQAPRLSDLPPDELPFESAFLPRRRYLSAATQRLIARLDLEGLPGGDFEPALVSEYGATISAAWSPIWHRAEPVGISHVVLTEGPSFRLTEATTGKGGGANPADHHGRSEVRRRVWVVGSCFRGSEGH